MKLFIEVATNEELNAPLSEAELKAVEDAVGRVRDGRFMTTNDPTERDQYLADAPLGVTFYRREEEKSDA